MLDKHLIVKTYPKAAAANVVRFADYRVSVLSDRLFRIERDEKGAFCDEATQSVWFRNMPAQKFSVKEDADSLTVVTDSVTLVLNRDFALSYAVVDGKNVPLTNDGNLRGTARTLDCYRADMHEWNRTPLSVDNGVCSLSGVAVIDDSRSLILKKNGEIAARPEESDLYVFAFGHDYRAAVKALYTITGYTPLIPRFALGNWWSRYYPYTDRKYLHVMDDFIERNVPITVATIDMDWHYVFDIDKKFGITKEELDDPKYGMNGTGYGWTGYTWDPALFPNYRDTLKKLHEKNLRVTLNLHPADGVRFYEAPYPEMAKAMGVDPKSRKHIPFDMTDTKFINNYFRILHKPYERDGVNFWWIDWQQGTKSNLTGLDPLWCLNHYHYLDNGLESKTPLILSRYCGIGSHRYPLGFSGDTIQKWDSLEFIPYFTATATNVGYTWWSHDIGAHMAGIKDDEMYLRYVQFGAFSPINRLHSTSHEMLSKAPWLYENGIAELAEKFLRLRHRMIPYVYSAGYRTHKFGEALIEPLYYAYPEEKDAYRFRNQYLFGGQLMVCPITKPSEYKGMTAMDVFVPAGKWTDIFTGDVYQGGRVIRMVRPLDSMPVLAPEGATFVLSDDKNTGNASCEPTRLEARIYTGNGSFSLYEGDDDASCKTVFTHTVKNGKIETKITFEGDAGIVPVNRTLKLVYANVPTGTVKVKEGRKAVPCLSDDNGALTVEFAFVPGKTYTVEVSPVLPDENAFINERVGYAIGRMQFDNDDRKRLYERLIDAKTLEERVAIIDTCAQSGIYRDRLYEVIGK